MCSARRFIIWPWAAPLPHSVKKFKLTFQIVQWTFKSEIMEVESDDKVKAAYDGESTIYRTPVSTQHTHLTSLWPGSWGVKLQKIESNPSLILHPSVNLQITETCEIMSVVSDSSPCILCYHTSEDSAAVSTLNCTESGTFPVHSSPR